MEVLLPPEEALTQMFEALLAGVDEAAPQAEVALLLARRLPIGLAQLRDLRPSSKGSARHPDPAAAENLAKPHRELAR